MKVQNAYCSACDRDVKIVLEQGQDPQRLLRPGMSVTPTVHTE